MSENFYNEDLNDFEELNTTCKSIYDLGEVKVLIILKDGTNLTDYLDIEDPEDVIYISEDLSGRMNLERYYYLGEVFERVYGDDSPVFARYAENPFRNIMAMVVRNVSNRVSSLDDMFRGLENLRTVSGLDSWDVGNVETMDSLFMECCNLRNVFGLDGWDVGNVYDMTWVFNGCRNLKDISDIENWDVGNAKSMRGMFKCCHGLENVSAVESWDINPNCDVTEMFFGTVFEDKYKSRMPKLKMEDDFEISNVKPELKCGKCASTNLVFDGGEIICSDCGNHLRSHFEIRCPDCGCSDIVYTGFHDLVCKRCERVILEEVYFDSTINWW